MCLQTTWTEPKVATKDIEVYKLLSFDNIPKSLYFRMEWELDKVYYTEMVTDTSGISFDGRAKIEVGNYSSEFIRHITRGFHSAIGHKRLDNISEYPESIVEGVIYKCVIPKGSLYYIGLTGLVVSNQIIIKEKIRKNR